MWYACFSLKMSGFWQHFSTARGSSRNKKIVFLFTLAASDFCHTGFKHRRLVFSMMQKWVMSSKIISWSPSFTYPRAGKPAAFSHLCLRELFLSSKKFKMPEEYFLAFSEKHGFAKFVEIIRNRYKWLRIAGRLMKVSRSWYAKMTAACIWQCPES